MTSLNQARGQLLVVRLRHKEAQQGPHSGIHSHVNAVIDGVHNQRDDAEPQKRGRPRAHDGLHGSLGHPELREMHLQESHEGAPTVRH